MKPLTPQEEAELNRAAHLIIRNIHAIYPKYRDRLEKEAAASIVCPEIWEIAYKEGQKEAYKEWKAKGSRLAMRFYWIVLYLYAVLGVYNLYALMLHWPDGLPVPGIPL